MAGDIGGTNSRLALFDSENLSQPVFTRIYPSGEYESLGVILDRFLDEVRRDFGAGLPRRAGLGIAGPVEGSHAVVTNLPWRVDADQLVARLGMEKVVLLNDFAAVAHAVPALGPGDLHQLGGGPPQPGHPMVVLGAGTGLGQGFLIPMENGFRVVSSEGGHSDYPPRTPQEIRLLAYLSGKFGRVSCERVVSGPGLVNIYGFLKEEEGMEESPDLAREISLGDPAAVISRRGLEGVDPICDRALDLFCSGYGSLAGNLALTVLAKGGVYLAGGIAAKILPRLESGGFRHSFENKGRFGGFLQTVPVFLITQPQPGLMGAALAASRDEPPPGTHAF